MTRIFLLIVLLVSALSLFPTPSDAQQAQINACREVEALLDFPIRPDLLIQGGGTLIPNAAVESTIMAMDAGDRWAVPAQQDAAVRLTFSSDIALRVRVFQNVVELVDEALPAGQNAVSFVPPQSGIYTVVVTRSDLLDETQVGTYSITGADGLAQLLTPDVLTSLDDARYLFYLRLRPSQTEALVELDFGGTADVRLFGTQNQDLFSNSVADEAITNVVASTGYYVLQVSNTESANVTLASPSNAATNAILLPFQAPRWEFPNAPELTLDDGITQFNLSSRLDVFAPADAFSNVSDAPRFALFDGISTIRFARNVLQEVALVDGGLSAVRENGGVVYVRDYPWEGELVDEANFATIILPNGQDVRVDWDVTERVYILPECIGIDLTDGRRILAEGQAVFARPTNTGNFQIDVDEAFGVNVDWIGLEQVEVSDGLVRLDFAEERTLQTDQANLNVRRTEDGSQRINSNNAPFVVTDWANIREFDIRSTGTTIDVLDERGLVERNGRDLQSLETSDGVMVLRWADGGESLILPEAEDFIQIETPPDTSAYDVQATPGEDGFLPANQNNTGLECYPINTALEFNCAPNGLVNPANGNLVLGMTDLHLPLYAQDLTLSRTYNSQNYRLDGPFGRGWSTDYIPDFDGEFDLELAARLLDGRYPLSLDLTQARRGQVIVTTASGSRHVFRNAEEGAPFFADTLPAWRIAARPDAIGDFWLVYREDGLFYEYDRAGRFVRMVTADNHELTLNRVSAFPAAIYRIQNPTVDAYLELEFDADQHVVRSALVVGAEMIGETRYSYTEDLLTGVEYDDGTVAEYRYDELGRLIGYFDWRAPLANSLDYVYDDDNRIVTINIPADTGVQQFHSYSYERTDERLTVTRRDEWGRDTTWVYAQTADIPYRLVGITDARAEREIVYENDLIGAINFEEPEFTQRLRYDALGALEAIVSDNTFSFSALYETIETDAHAYPVLSRYENRAGIALAEYIYDQNGQVVSVENAEGVVQTVEERHPIFSLPTRISVEYSDAPPSIIRLDYDARGYPILREDEQGLHQFEWDAAGRLISYVDPLERSYTISYGPVSLAYLSFIANCMVITDPLENENRYCFDLRQRLIDYRVANEDEVLRHANFGYDRFDRLIQRRDFLAEPDSARATDTLVTTYEYVSALDGHRIVREVDPLGRVIETEFDAQERIVRYADALGRQATYSYELGSGVSTYVITRQDATGLETRLEYNLAHQLCSVIYDDAVYQTFYGDAQNCNIPDRFLGQLVVPQRLNARFEGVDSQGRPSRAVYFTSVPTDAEPNTLRPATNADQFSIEYDFDARGRLITYAVNQNVAFADQSERVTFAYSGNTITVTREVNGVQQQTTYTYDALERLTMVSTDDEQITFSYQDNPARHVVDVTVQFGESLTWVLSYDILGNLRAWRNADGATTRYQYDQLGRLMDVTVDSQPVASYSYNELSQVSLIRNESQQSYRYVYDERGLLTTERDFEGVATVYTYDPFGNLSTVTDAQGNRTTYLYDQANRVISIVDPSGREQLFDWSRADIGRVRYRVGDRETDYYFDVFGRLWQVRDAEGGQHYLRYDRSGRLTGFYPNAPIEAYSNIAATAYAYGIDNQLTVIDGPDDWNWVLGYDAFSRLTSRTNPNAALVDLGYDALGRVTRIGDRSYGYSANTIEVNGIPLTYDDLYRLTSNSSHTYTYTDGRDFTLTDADGRITNYIYPDAFDESAALIVESGERQWRYLVNSRGLLSDIQEIEIIDGVTYERQENLVYDGLGRPIRYLDGQDNAYIYTYGTFGNLVAFQSPDGSNYFYGYDNLHRLTSIQNPGNRVLTLDYNAEGQLAFLSLNGERLESYRYNLNGLIEDYDFQGGSVTYRYDNAGHAIAQIINGEVLSIERDEFGRILQVGNLAAFDYDTLGRVIEAQAGSRRETFSLDNEGRLAMVEQSNSATWTYAYSADGVQISLDDAVMIEIAVDALGRLREISTPENEILIDYRVRVSDNVIQAELAWGDGYTTQVRFNRLGQIIRVAHDRPQDIDFTRSDFEYSVNYLGLPQNISEPEYDIFIGYDSAYRAATSRWLYTGVETQLQDSIQYAFTITYDEFGNRVRELKQFDDNQQSIFTYTTEGNRLDQRIPEAIGMIGSLILVVGVLRRRRLALLGLIPLLALGAIELRQSPTLQDTANARIYEYNPSGYVERIRSNDVITDLSYDALGRLIRIDGAEANSTFAYDAFGRLVRWTSARLGTIEYRYNGDQLIQVVRDGQPVTALHADQMPLVLLEGETDLWALYNGLGGLYQSFEDTHENGSIITRQDVFGVAPLDDIPPETALWLPFFNGMLYDADHGLYISMDGRAYDPIAGFFLQRDLLGVDVTGDSVSFRQAQASLPILQPMPYPFFEGLETLVHAGQIPNPPTSGDILAQHQPNFTRQWMDAGLTDLHAFNAAMMGDQAHLSVLSSQLAYEYNPLGVYVDGNFRFQETFYQRPQGVDLPSLEIELPEIAPTISTGWAFPEITPDLEAPRWYAPDGWRNLNALSMELPAVAINLPDATLLPLPLVDLTAYGDLISALENLPTAPIDTWVAEIEADILPQPPSVPPLSMAEWLEENYFSFDTLPNWAQLRDIYSLPEAPAAPVPSLSN